MSAIMRKEVFHDEEEISALQFGVQRSCLSRRYKTKGTSGKYRGVSTLGLLPGHRAAACTYAKTQQSFLFHKAILLMTRGCTLTTERAFVYRCPVLQAASLVVGRVTFFTIVGGHTVRA